MSKCRFNNPTVKEQSNNDEELSTIPKYNRNAVRYGSENDSEDLNELERVISSHIPKNLKIRTYNSRLSYEKIKIRGPQGKTLMQREQEFLELLSQLTDRDTQDQAYHQILKLFSQNAKDRDCLQLYLNTLVNKNRCMSGLLNTEYEVILLTNLISMCEGNKNNESTIDNIVSYLNVALCQDSSGVAEAVAQCYMHILEYLIIPKFGVNIQTICDLLLNPLSTLFNGEDRISQKGAIHCLFFILRGSKDENRRELFRFLYKFIIKHFIGSAVINEEYFDCISYCIQYGRVNNIARYVVPIIDM